MATLPQRATALPYYALQLLYERKTHTDTRRRWSIQDYYESYVDSNDITSVGELVKSLEDDIPHVLVDAQPDVMPGDHVKVHAGRDTWVVEAVSSSYRNERGKTVFRWRDGPEDGLAARDRKRWVVQPGA